MSSSDTLAITSHVVWRISRRCSKGLFVHGRLLMVSELCY